MSTTPETKTLNTIIQLRHDSETNWETNGKDRVLKDGEMGVSFDASGKPSFKIGYGDKKWSELEFYASAQPASIYDIDMTKVVTSENAALVPEGGHVLSAGVDIEDDVEVIEDFVGSAELQAGDIAIVRRPIAGDTISYTSYVYNGTAWAATDGNYSAKNVFLKNNITLAGNFTSIGNYSKGKTINAGTSLEDLFSGMLQQELLPPTAVASMDVPNASITISGTESGEVGSSYTLPTATLKITDVGSYPYGTDAQKSSGISFAIGSVKLAEGADPDTATNYTTNAGVMTKNSTITLQASGETAMYADTSKTYTFSGTASYAAGNIPVTNLGNACAAGQIPAGSVSISDASKTFSGYRKAFAGGTTASAIDSVVARSMTATKNSKGSMDSQSEALEFTAAAGTTKVFFTYPSSWTGTPYFEMFGLAWAENTDIVAKSNIQVADARGTVDGVLQGAMDYKLYCWELSTPLQAESTKFRVWFK